MSTWTKPMQKNKVGRDRPAGEGPHNAPRDASGTRGQLAGEDALVCHEPPPCHPDAIESLQAAAKEGRTSNTGSFSHQERRANPRFHFPMCGCSERRIAAETRGSEQFQKPKRRIAAETRRPEQFQQLKAPNSC